MKRCLRRQFLLSERGGQDEIVEKIEMGNNTYHHLIYEDESDYPSEWIYDCDDISCRTKDNSMKVLKLEYDLLRDFL